MKDIWQRDENGVIKRSQENYPGWGYLREEIFEELQAYMCMLGGTHDRGMGEIAGYSDGVYFENQYNLDKAWPVGRLHGRPVGWIGFLNDDGTLKPQDPDGDILYL